MESRLEWLRKKLKEKEFDAIFVSTPENRRYMSGFAGSSGYLLISQKDALLATDFRYYEQVGRQSPNYKLVKITGPLDTWLTGALSDLKAKRVAFEANNVSVSFFNLIKSTLDKMPADSRPEFVPSSDIVEDLRIVKEPSERVLLQRAIDIADASFTYVAAEKLKPGITEKQVAWELEKHMRELGAEGPSFDTIIASGANAALPHHHPTDKPIQRGESIVIDMGAKYEGYCSDLSRTVTIGKPDAQFRKIYDIVLGAQLTAIAAVNSSMTGGDCDALARKVIEDAGYGPQFGHGTGHGVGLEIHENPRVSKNSKSKLGDGMFFTVEPGIYIEGWGGVRIEDIVMMENGKAIDLSHAHKKELIGA